MSHTTEMIQMLHHQQHTRCNGSKPGDQIRVDIPDETDPDHERLHGRSGTIVDVIADDAGQTTGDVRDSYLFRVEL